MTSLGIYRHAANDLKSNMSMAWFLAGETVLYGTDKDRIDAIVVGFLQGGKHHAILYRKVSDKAFTSRSKSAKQGDHYITVDCAVFFEAALHTNEPHLPDDRVQELFDEWYAEDKKEHAHEDASVSVSAAAEAPRRAKRAYHLRDASSDQCSPVLRHRGPEHATAHEVKTLSSSVSHLAHELERARDEISVLREKIDAIPRPLPDDKRRDQLLLDLMHLPQAHSLASPQVQSSISWPTSPPAVVSYALPPAAPQQAQYVVRAAAPADTPTYAVPPGYALVPISSTQPSMHH